MLPVRTMTPTSVSIVVVACTVAAVAASQAPSEPPRFRVAVDAVSIDAVVTDRTGRGRSRPDRRGFRRPPGRQAAEGHARAVRTRHHGRCASDRGRRAECGPGAPRQRTMPRDAGAADHARAGAADDRSRRRRPRTLRRRHEQYPAGAARVRGHRTAADGPRRDRPDGRVEGHAAVAHERPRGARGRHRRAALQHHVAQGRVARPAT